MFFRLLFLSLWLCVNCRGESVSSIGDHPWKTGDIIGVSEPHYDGSTFFFESATGSRFGHIGVVVLERGKPVVYESNPPQGAQKVKLKEFLGRSHDKNGEPLASVVRPKKSLSKKQESALISTVRKMVKAKIPYNYSQMVNEESKNCSEFVQAAFEGAGVSVGKIEKPGALNLQAFGGKLLELWGEPIPKTARFVSPFSIMSDNGVQHMAGNLPTRRILSEQEILQAWVDEGAFKHILAAAMDESMDSKTLQRTASRLAKSLLQIADEEPFRKTLPGGGRCSLRELAGP